MIKLSLITIALFSSITANAAYIIKIPIDKSAVGFKQAYENIGVNPNDDNTSTDNPACLIKNSDFSLFGGVLLRITEDGEMKCVVDISIPKNVFDGDCNENAYPESVKLWDMMRSKGVDAVNSMFYSGECSA